MRRSICLFGSDSLSLGLYTRVTGGTHGVNITRVVTPPPKPAGRNLLLERESVLRARLARAPVQLITAPRGHSSSPDWSEFHEARRKASSETTAPNGFDLGLVFSYGHFIPREVIESFREGCVNVHPSLLPDYRGSAPIERALMNGETKTGVSIIEVSPHRFDVGDVLAQTEVVIPNEMKFLQLAETLVDLGADLLLKVLDDLPGARAKARVQSQSTLASAPRKKAPKIASEERTISFQTQSSGEIWNRCRALEEVRGISALFGDFSSEDNVRVALERSLPPVKLHGPISPPGTMRIEEKDPDAMFIKCLDDDVWLPVIRVKVAGKNSASGRAFFNGYRRRLGHRFM